MPKENGQNSFFHKALKGPMYVERFEEYLGNRLNLKQKE